MSDDNQVLKNIPQKKLNETRKLYEDDGYVVEVEVQRDGQYTINAKKPREER